MSRLWATAKLDRAAPLRGPRLLPPPPRGWDEGYAEGRATVEAEVAAERAALGALGASLVALDAPEAGPIAHVIETVAARLAIAAAGDGGIDLALLAARAAAAAEALAGEATEVVLLFHPDDLARLEPGDFAQPLAADPDLPRGSVRAERGLAWATDGVAEAIARIVEAARL